MKKGLIMFFFVLFFIIGCFRAPLAEIEVKAFNPLAYYIAYDTISVHDTIIWTDQFKTYSFTTIAPDTYLITMLRYRAIIDSISFIVKNKVDVMLRGYYIEFYEERGVDSLTPLDTTPYYAIGPYIWGADTAAYSIYNFPIPCWDAAVHLYTTPNLGSIRMHVKFYGEDIYNHRNIETTVDFGLIKAK